MTTHPADLIRSPKWRLTHSIGILWAILSFGLLACVTFTYRGIRMKKWTWIIIAAASAAISWTSLSITPSDPESPQAGVLSVVFLAHWGIAIAVAIATNKTWLRWRATQVPWYAETAPPAFASQPAPNMGDKFPEDPQGSQAPQALDAQQFPPHGDSYTRSSSSVLKPRNPLNVNSAQKTDLTHLGLSDQDSSRILDARKNGTYSSFDELLTRTGVPPHILFPIKDSITFSWSSNQDPGNKPKNASPRSRTLDL